MNEKGDHVVLSPPAPPAVCDRQPHDEGSPEPLPSMSDWVQPQQTSAETPAHARDGAKEALAQCQGRSGETDVPHRTEDAAETQAQRWSRYTAQFEAGPGAIPLADAFRLRKGPLSSDPNHPFDQHATWSPFADLLNGGLHPGEVLSIGGPPASGKSTFALQLADAIAAANADPDRAGGRIVPILYVSLELDGYELMQISLSRLSCVNVAHIHSGGFRDEAEASEAAAQAQARYRERIAPWLKVLDVDYFGSAPCTIETIGTQVRQLKADFGAETAAVFIDPVSRLTTGATRIDRSETARVHELSRRLHTIAKRDHVAVVIVADTVRAAAADPKEQDHAAESNCPRGDAISRIASTVLELARGDELRDIFPDVYKDATLMLDSIQLSGKLNASQRKLSERIKKAGKFPLEAGLLRIATTPKPHVGYRGLYTSEYAAALCTKRRWNEATPIIFHYHKSIRTFEELPV